MRGHHLKIAVTSGLLCTVFIVGLYFCTSYQEKIRLASASEYNFTFSFAEESNIDAKTVANFRQIDGVSRVHVSHSEKDALALASHVLFEKKDVKAFSGLTEYPKGDDYFVTNDTAYHCAMDEALIDQLAESYRFEGDPYAILTQKDAVIIGASYQNREVLDYQVGDSVYVAVLAEKEPIMDYVLSFDENGFPVWNLVERETESKELSTTYHDVMQGMLTGEKQLLRQIERLDFVYRKLTVAAVIYDYPSAAKGIPLIMNRGSYLAVTGEEPKANALYISADSSLLSRVCDALDGEIDTDTVVTFTGSLPAGVSVADARDMLLEMKAKGAKIVIDSRSFKLDDIKAVRPWLIKPNEEEIAMYSALEVNDLESAAIAAAELCKSAFGIFIVRHVHLHKPLKHFKALHALVTGGVPHHRYSQLKTLQCFRHSAGEVSGGHKVYIVQLI